MKKFILLMMSTIIVIVLTALAQVNNKYSNSLNSDGVKSNNNILNAPNISNLGIFDNIAKTGISDTSLATINIDLANTLYPYLGLGWNVHPVHFQDGNWDSIRMTLDAAHMQFVRMLIDIQWWQPDSNVLTLNSPNMESICMYLDYCQEKNIVIEFSSGCLGGKYDGIDYWWLANCCRRDPTNSQGKWFLEGWWGVVGPEVDHPYDEEEFASTIMTCLKYLINEKGYTCIKYLGFWNEPNGSWGYNARDMDNDGQPDYEYPGSFYPMYEKFNRHLNNSGLNHVPKLVGCDYTVRENDPLSDFGTTLSAWSGGQRCDFYLEAMSFHSYWQNDDALHELCSRARQEIYNNDYDGNFEDILVCEFADDAIEVHETAAERIHGSIVCAKKIIGYTKEGAYALARWGYNNLGGRLDDATVGKGERPVPQNFYPMQLYSATLPQGANCNTIKTDASSTSGYFDAVTIQFEEQGETRNVIWVINDDSSNTQVTVLLNNLTADATFEQQFIDFSDSNCTINSGDWFFVNTTNPQFELTIPPKCEVVFKQVPESSAIPVADFSADKTLGQFPLNVQFLNLSSGYIKCWNWNFGDEQKSTEQNPVHIYQQPGIYTVSLNVSGPKGSDMKTQKNFIIVSDTTVHFVTHNTENLQVSIFGNGNIGHLGATPTGDGVKYKESTDALFSSGLILGTKSRGSVNGHIGSFGINNDLVSLAPISNFEVQAPYWDQKAKAIFNDACAPAPYGIMVNQTSFSNTGDNYILISYRLHGNGSTVNDLFIGLFADWDIVDCNSNLAGYDNTRNMAYQYLSDNSNYFGIIALNGMAGARVTSEWVNEGVRDSSFNWISTFLNEPISTPADYRMWIGSGPFSLSANDSFDVYFALVAGTNLSNLQANADVIIEKHDLITSINSKKDVITIPEQFSLSQNYPNPFNPSTNIRYFLPKSCFVTIKIYNLLGNEIETLQNQQQAAGEYQVNWNAKNLSSGLYFCRMQVKDLSSSSGVEFVQTKKIILQK